MDPNRSSLSFDWNPADYSRSSPAQHQWAGELIAKLVLRGDERVLDIGCGDGRVTAMMAKNVPRGSVVGIDSSAEMIRFSRDHFPPDKNPNLSFMQVDAQKLTFHDEFDLVFSNAALHWIPCHRAVLAGIRRSLREDGKMLVQMGGKGNAAKVFEAFELLRREPRWEPYFRNFSFVFGFFGPEEYRGWLGEAGLTPVRIELIGKDMVYQSREDFAAWIRTTWLPHLRQLPEEIRPPFIDALIDRYLALSPVGTDGIFHIGMKRLEVEAGLRHRPGHAVGNR